MLSEFTLYRMHTWQLDKKDTVIIRADCNVPFQNGTILNDSRLNILIPTINTLLNTGAQIVLLTHWGRPKKGDLTLSTKHLIPWFTKQGINASYIDSPCTLIHKEYNAQQRFFICENIRFLDNDTIKQWISCLQQLGTHFIHDGFSVMHRDDPFNTKLPRLFAPEKKSLGIAAVAEIDLLDSFMQHSLQEPALGIFGGSKIETKIDAILQLTTHYLTNVILLPPLCMPFLETKPPMPTIHDFKEVVNLYNRELFLPIDLLVTTDPQYQPPYIPISVSQVASNQQIVTIGPKTEIIIRDQIHKADAIIINGISGFLTIPESLEPMLRLLQYIIDTKKTCLLLGGDTCALLQKYQLAHYFPFHVLSGGAALDYCAGKELPGLLALE